MKVDWGTLIPFAMGILFFFAGMYTYFEGRATLSWDSVPGEITSVGTHSETSTSSSESGSSRTTSYYVDVTYQYSVKGREYRGERIGITETGYGSSSTAESIAQSYRNRPNVTVYYDPDDPSEAVLEQGGMGSGIIFMAASFIPLIIFIVFLRKSETAKKYKVSAYIVIGLMVATLVGFLVHMLTTGDFFASSLPDPVTRTHHAIAIKLDKPVRGTLTRSKSFAVYKQTFDEETELLVSITAEFEHLLKVYRTNEENPVLDETSPGIAQTATSKVTLPQGDYEFLIAKSGFLDGDFTIVLTEAPSQDSGDQATKIPFSSGQIWQGSYQCQRTKSNLKIRVESVRGTRVDAIFDFQVTGGGDAQGEFRVSGAYVPETRSLTLLPGEWINRPSGYLLSGLSGVVSDDGSEYSGDLTLMVCGQFKTRLSR